MKTNLTFRGVMGIWTRSDKDVPPPSSHRWAMSLGWAEGEKFTHKLNLLTQKVTGLSKEAEKKYFVNTVLCPFARLPNVYSKAIVGLCASSLESDKKYIRLKTENFV